MKRSALYGACRAHLGGKASPDEARVRAGAVPKPAVPDDPRPRTAGSGE